MINLQYISFEIIRRLMYTTTRRPVKITDLSTVILLQNNPIITAQYNFVLTTNKLHISCKKH